MNKILVAGLINIETSLKVDSFPIDYSPIEYPFFGIESCVSGVGYNIAKALKTLGSDFDFVSEIGDDLNGEIIKKQLEKDKINSKNCAVVLHHKTAESVVLVDKENRRKIYCDLKDIQDGYFPNENIVNLNDYKLAVLTNINFNRNLLNIAKEKNIIIATDVHVLSDINDSYNEDFMKASNILFLSNEMIKGREGDFLKEIYNKYHNDIIVCGCGEEGALMYIGKENKYYYEKAIAPKGIESTLGAGDALFSSFIHFFNKGYSYVDSLHFAVYFAGVKINKSGGSNGFINEEELFEIMNDKPNHS